MNNKFSAYKPAAMCAVLALAGLALSVFESGSLVFAVFFGLLTVGELVYETRLIWRQYQLDCARKENNSEKINSRAS